MIGSPRLSKSVVVNATWLPELDIAFGSISTAYNTPYYCPNAPITFIKITNTTNQAVSLSFDKSTTILTLQPGEIFTHSFLQNSRGGNLGYFYIKASTAPTSGSVIFNWYY
jgi:hypothetical protein